MTKKEIQKQKLQAIFAAVNEKFNVVVDFDDIEGHGYFEFVVEENNHEFHFMLTRRDYEVMGYSLKGDKHKAEHDALEQKIQHVIDEVVEKIDNEIQSSLINQGLGLTRA